MALENFESAITEFEVALKENELKAIKYPNPKHDEILIKTINKAKNNLEYCRTKC